MANFNKVFLMGNLTRDPQLGYTPSGTAVAKMGIAINRKYHDSKTNEMKDETTFVDLEAWGRTAELASQYLAKGRLVFIDGRLRLDKWQDKTTGQNRQKLLVVVENIQFLDAKGAGGGPERQPRQPAQANADTEPPVSEPPEPEEFPEEPESGQDSDGDGAAPKDNIPF